MIQDIIHYEQQLGDRNDIPRNYYDPNIMLADRPFLIQPRGEVLIIINGSGYSFSDDTIFEFEIPQPQNSEDSGENKKSLRKDRLKNINPPEFSSKQLCLHVKNYSTLYTIHVGSKSSLAWLLDMPRIFSKLCYCNVSDLTELKLEYNQLNIVNHDNDDDDEGLFEASEGKIYIC